MHQPEIEQGNIITQKMVDQLRPQMTKPQVEFVLGKPVYQNSFNVNRWDYVFTKESRTGERERKVLTLRFEEGELVGISGDYRPQGDAAEELESLLEPAEDDDSDGDETEADQIESIDSEEEIDSDVEASN
ncbi:MAG: outer membrane protein assembly factor BamE [Gammaproteobacteria bacterium]|nr:outer membrane protein assembly factor BamE [Gammaproteobacteria bacterium]MYF02475.1 outer membrane protein assembly factor BamE [Gammaproteobacteria bacterium]MYI77426.1 outer membrane protein assembly factor BamE [Gammaproteobacteria bacterium]